ncbi:Agmatine coumaroyltransferase-2 [Dichanthelium oligosanthes]|uniref:Agmatine coumaroyltransferase-2 n=1 Tax=Dichanthelium oligosanthes TaxID=888268 RepID=A0A1E5UTV9_9POAL|nr:Agmatine coumaroyltransferase-2 [Dichanthelium oligosanthes]
MEIVVQSSKAVKPAYGESSSWDTQGVDVVPLSVLDEVHDEYMSSIHAFHPPAPTNAVLEAGLARALAEYREWAGRLGVDQSTGRGAILLNDAGALFVEATADVALEAIMPLLLPATPVVARLHPSGEGAKELMLVQITRFACGSLVVGHTMHHAVGDGLSICQCLLAWSQSTRGVAIDPVPVHDRVSFFVPRDPPQVEFDHRNTEFKAPADDDKDPRCTDTDDAIASNHVDDEVVTHKVHFSREFISDLKSRASATMLRPYSTMQCLVAHLWRCVTKARGLDGDETTTLHIAVNGRARMRRPRVPQGYTGNVVLWAHPTTTTGELLAGPLGHASELIRQGVARVDDAYFRSFIDFISSGAVEDEGLEPMADAAVSPDVEVYCLYRIPFYDLDFGGGRQFMYMPSNRPVDGAIYILPPLPHGDGSVEAHVSLSSRSVDAFKDCCCSLVPDVLL